MKLSTSGMGQQPHEGIYYLLLLLLFFNIFSPPNCPFSFVLIGFSIYLSPHPFLFCLVIMILYFIITSTSLLILIIKTMD